VAHGGKKASKVPQDDMLTIHGGHEHNTSVLLLPCRGKPAETRRRKWVELPQGIQRPNRACTWCLTSHGGLHHFPNVHRAHYLGRSPYNKLCLLTTMTYHIFGGPNFPLILILTVLKAQTQSLPIQAMATNITFHPGISPHNIASISLT